MRILSLPAALALAFCLYLPLPGAVQRLRLAFEWLYDQMLRLFSSRNDAKAQGPALICMLLLLGGFAVPLCALHPVVCVLLTMPVFTALAKLPEGAALKTTLDSGAYARDIPAYEAQVLRFLLELGPAFVKEACVPMLLIAVGMPLHIGCALGIMDFALRVAAPKNTLAKQICSRLYRLADAIFCAMLVLCSGAVGRNPLRTRGRGAQSRLLSILGVGEEATHAPVAGDITQGIFLCCLCILLLCLMLCAIFFFFC